MNAHGKRPMAIPHMGQIRQGGSDVFVSVCRSHAAPLVFLAAVAETPSIWATMTLLERDATAAFAQFISTGERFVKVGVRPTVPEVHILHSRFLHVTSRDSIDNINCLPQTGALMFRDRR